MARAKRHYLPGYAWHITHRCHEREFLLKFRRDRRRWLQWLFEAKKRYGLCVLNYMVTCNHIHLLVFDRGGQEVISRSIQLMAGRTAQDYNQRKQRKGAFWEDRYHSTAVETNQHLARCLVYIDLNMVRAGVVKHPAVWKESGYGEIQHPGCRYRLIDQHCLMELLGISSPEVLRESHRSWVEEALRGENHGRDSKWSQSIAVGSEEFVTRVQKRLGSKAKGRKPRASADGWQLREPGAAYSRISGAENDLLRSQNLHCWKLYSSETDA